MGINIGSSFLYKGTQFLDERQGFAKSIDDLKNWSVPIPNGFEVYLESEKIWYTYDSLTFSEITGFFKKREDKAAFEEISKLEKSIETITSNDIFDITEKHYVRDSWFQIHGISNTIDPAHSGGSYFKAINQPNGEAEELVVNKAKSDLTTAYLNLKSKLTVLKLYEDTDVIDFDRDELSSLFAAYYNNETELYKVVSRGLKGDSSITVQIYSTQGNQFINRNITTTLQAWVFKGSNEITSELSSSKFNWKRKSLDASGDLSWNELRGKGIKSIDLTNSDINRKAVFDCEVDIS